MTAVDIVKMPIEDIIRLPNFQSLTSCGGIENATEFEPIREPYWEIRFKAERIVGTGKYKAFDMEIPHNTYLIHKFKNQ